MIKFGFLLVIAVVCSFSTQAVSADTCNVDGGSKLFNDIVFPDMKNKCVEATENQIKMEVTASLQYLRMGSYFSRDNVDRPGFAKFFFAAAGEEREHAYKLIEYLSMRGRYIEKENPSKVISKFDIGKLVTESDSNKVKTHKGEDVTVADLEPTSAETTSGLIALQNALKLEKIVTASIRNLIEVCEKDEDFNDYHFVDYLTSDFLDEQYKGQRDLAGKINTLGKMVQRDGGLIADFLYDKELL